MGGRVSIEGTESPSDFATFIVAILTGSENLPLASQLFAVLLICGSIFVTLRQSRVLTVPTSGLTTCLAILMGCLLLAEVGSPTKAQGLITFAQWCTYYVAFLATMSTIGRKRGHMAINWAIVGGCTVAAVYGILGYQEMRSIDPTWRTFGTWAQPNALGGLLATGWLLCLGLCLQSSRVYALVAGILTLPIGMGLILTQSKGAILSLLVALALVFVAILVCIKEKGRPLILVGRIVAVTAGFFAVGFLLQRQSNAPAPAPAPAPVSANISYSQATAHLVHQQEQPQKNAVSRLTNVEGQNAQSFTFRKNLWKGAIEMIKRRPFGWGLGSYFNYSAATGITTGTQFAHQSFLQLMVEASPVAGLALIAFLILWFRQMLSGISRVPADFALRRITYMAGVLSIVGNGLIESNLFLFGIGVLLFVLLAAGAQSSDDSSNPEMVKPAERVFSYAATAVTAILFLYVARGEQLRAGARMQIRAQKQQDAAAEADNAIAWMPFDGEAHYLRATTSSSGEEALRHLVLATEYKPFTKFYRNLGLVQEKLGKPVDAMHSFESGLALDPNNLLILKEYIRIQQTTNEGLAQELAKRCVAIESTPYYQIRSIPELVPVETFFAREYLAGFETEPAKKVELLQPALEGYDKYRTTTWPNVQRMAKSTPPFPFAGETPKTAAEKLTAGARIATNVANALRQLGRVDEAGKAEELGKRLAEEAALAEGLIK